MDQTVFRPFPLQAVLGVLVSRLESPEKIDVIETARRYCDLVQAELDAVVPAEAKILFLTDRVISINLEEEEVADYLRYAETAVSHRGVRSYLVDCD